MDKIADQLKTDAERIDARVPEALRGRVDAAIGPVPRPQAEAPPRPTRAVLALGSVAAGLAAALAVVMLRPTPAVDAPEPGFAATPRYEELLPAPPVLATQTAEFTQPLQEELDALRSDIERARKRIESDLRDTL